MIWVFQKFMDFLLKHAQLCFTKIILEQVYVTRIKVCYVWKTCNFTLESSRYQENLWNFWFTPHTFIPNTENFHYLEKKEQKLTGVYNNLLFTWKSTQQVIHARTQQRTISHKVCNADHHLIVSSLLYLH